MFCRSLFVLSLFFYWSLHCLSFFDLRLQVTPLVSCGHCIVCYSSNYGFWLPLWYLVDIVLSVILRITASGYPFGILWTLYCLLFFELRLLVTPLISCGHCIVCYSSNYGFRLPLWYLVDIVLSVILRITASGYPFGILWTLCCLLFFELRLQVTPLVSCGHCIVCYSSNYGFRLPLWYLVDIVLSVILRITASGYPFGILWTLYCLLFFELRLLVTPLVSCGHCIVCYSSNYGFRLPLWYLVDIVLSVILRITASGYPFGILWTLYCLLFFELRLLVTPLVSCGHCVVCYSSNYGFRLPLWYLVDIVLSVILRITASGYPFGILWTLYCLLFFELRLLVTPLVSCGHCIVCYSSNYGFWLPLWYLVDIVLSVILRITASGYPFGILWTLYCLLFFELRLLVTPLVSCGHCIVCYSSNYGFRLPL